MEVVGRTLIHVSVDPFTFAVGVGTLWLHKQLEVAEIGHTALHGTFDKLPGAERFHSKTFRWRFPVDEESCVNATTCGTTSTPTSLAGIRTSTSVRSAFRWRDRADVRSGLDVPDGATPL